MITESQIVDQKRALWQGRLSAERSAELTQIAYGPQHLKNTIETDIVRRFLQGERVLDVGIGTGRVSLPLVENGVKLTGVDASAAMIEQCGGDARALSVRLVHGELERLPFAREAFDTVISVDTFLHLPDWTANLDELLRVTRIGGRVIVDVGSTDHVEAVAQQRGCSLDTIRAAEIGRPEAYILRLSVAELHTFAAQRNITLLALVPYGVVLGSLAPNHWFTHSYAFRSGVMDRLVSWIGADPLVFSFVEFIERRIAQASSPSWCGRMFAIFERSTTDSAPSRHAEIIDDERRALPWMSEFATHMKHEPNRHFAVAFLLAARPVVLPAAVRGQLPAMIQAELERAEQAAQIDEVCSVAMENLYAGVHGLDFHGVDLAGVFAPSIRRAIRAHLELHT